MIDLFDIAVVGAGPAGAVTALCLARRGWRVALFESTSFDKERFGETLPPEANPILRSLGLWETFLSLSPLESPGIVSSWGSPKPTQVDFTGNPFGCGWHVDRNQFDLALCQQAVAAGAELFLNCAKKWTESDGGWRSEGIHAKFLVNASGRNGLVIGHAKSRVPEDALLAIVVQLTSEECEFQDQRTLVEAAPDGWWYSTRLPGRSGLAMFFTGAEVYREHGISMQEQLDVAPMTRTRLHTARITHTQMLYAPTGYSTALAGANWVAVGDSASAYDPLSGRGIFKALRHGEAAARAVDSTLGGREDAMQMYVAQVHRDFKTYSSQRTRYYMLEQRWSNHPFWKARHSVI